MPGKSLFRPTARPSFHYSVETAKRRAAAPNERFAGSLPARQLPAGEARGAGERAVGPTDTGMGRRRAVIAARQQDVVVRMVRGLGPPRPRLLPGCKGRGECCSLQDFPKATDLWQRDGRSPAHVAHGKVLSRDEYRARHAARLAAPRRRTSRPAWHPAEDRHPGPCPAARSIARRPSSTSDTSFGMLRRIRPVAVPGSAELAVRL